MRGIALLGSTGSIGRSTLDVLRRHQGHFRLVALTAGRKREEFAAQVAEWRPSYAGLAGVDDGPWPSGPEVLVEAATLTICYNQAQRGRPTGFDGPGKGQHTEVFRRIQR